MTDHVTGNAFVSVERSNPRVTVRRSRFIIKVRNTIPRDGKSVAQSRDRKWKTRSPQDRASGRWRCDVG